MPIRMVEDDPGGNQQQRRRSNRGGGFAGGGGGFGSIIGSLLPMLFRSPKLLGVIIVIGLLFYFLGGSNLFNNTVQSVLGLGATLDPEKYEQTEIFEALADNVKNPLPESVSLEKYCPPRLNQGKQGSCVGWASAYAARTILQSRATGDNPRSSAFSPSYLYNQIALKNCQGSYISKAMENMQQGGVLPFSKFGYTERDCSDQPDRNERQQAANFKIKGYNRLTKGNEQKTDLLAIKQNLAQGAPVVIGMLVGGSFMQDMAGKDVWIPRESDYQMYGFGGHAMCLIGYDDYKEGGAFQIMNSWGEEWGKNGLGWVRYSDFDYFTREAYGLYPMGTSEVFNESRLALEFSLVDKEGLINIPLKQVGNNTFATKTPMKKGTKFKVELTNSIECYTYIFGEETDGSSYTLFPYTEKHSPYCGITGTRIFPKDYSMQADDLGSKDRIAIVLSKQILNYKLLNDAINQSPGRDYQDKVENVLRDEMVQDINYKQGSTIKFDTNMGSKNAVVIIIEVDKY